jgi:hypothetical protein
MLRRLIVDEEELEKQIAKAAKSKRSGSSEIKRMEKLYTVLLCPKCKAECEPAYCTFQITNTCPFLAKWRSLSKKYSFSQ